MSRNQNGNVTALDGVSCRISGHPHEGIEEVFCRDPCLESAGRCWLSFVRGSLFVYRLGTDGSCEIVDGLFPRDPLSEVCRG